MKYKKKYFHCGDFLQNSLKSQIDEIVQCVTKIKWEPEFIFESNGRNILRHQRAYNKAFDTKFRNFKWEQQPLLLKNPRLIGDFRKGLVFVEIQFGNSATLYRDYYKFQYGHANGLLSLAVLIVPTNPAEFFPTRPSSVNNMAEYELANRYLTMLPIRVPVLLIGLLPEN
jgi:hypothetical protein